MENQQDVMASGLIKKKKKTKKQYKPTFVRIGVWTCLVAFTGASIYTSLHLPLLLKSSLDGGTGSTAKADQPLQIENTVGVANFARNFSFYWLSGDMDTAQKFAAEGFNFPENAFEMVKKQTVNSVEVWNVSQKSKDQIHVVVEAKVTVDGETNLNSLFVSVPVVVEPGGKFGVYDIPTIIPNPGKAKAPKSNSNGGLVSAETENKVKFIIESFFRFYSQGQSKDLSLLFVDENPRVTLQGKYIQLNEVSMKALDENKIEAKATAWLEINNLKVLQSYEFVLVKKDSSWRIESTYPFIPIEK